MLFRRVEAGARGQKLRSHFSPHRQALRELEGLPGPGNFEMRLYMTMTIGDAGAAC